MTLTVPLEDVMAVDVPRLFEIEIFSSAVEVDAAPPNLASTPLLWLWPCERAEEGGGPDRFVRGVGAMGTAELGSDVSRDIVLLFP